MSEAIPKNEPIITLSSEIIKDSPFRMPRSPANFSIMLGYHTLPNDLEEQVIRPLLEAADVVLLEGVGWDSQDLNLIRHAARRGVGDKKGLSPYSLKTAELISGTDATYHFWDPNVDDKTKAEWRLYYSGRDPQTNLIYVSSIDEYRQKLEIKCELAMIRDKLALEDLGKKIDSLAPVKKTKRPINIVIIAGVMHQILGQRILLAQDDSHKVDLAEVNIDDGPAKYLRNKIAASEPLGDAELIRMLLTDIFVQRFADQDGENTVSILERAHSSIALLSHEQIQEATAQWFNAITQDRIKTAEKYRRLDLSSRRILTEMLFKAI